MLHGPRGDCESTFFTTFLSFIQNYKAQGLLSQNQRYKEVSSEVTERFCPGRSWCMKVGDRGAAKRGYCPQEYCILKSKDQTGAAPCNVVAILAFEI